MLQNLHFIRKDGNQVVWLVRPGHRLLGLGLYLHGENAHPARPAIDTSGQLCRPVPSAGSVGWGALDLTAPSPLLFPWYPGQEMGCGG